MRVKIIKAAALCLAVMLGVGICLAGCTKKPSQPPPVEPKEYYVYFGDVLSPLTCFRYQTGTGIMDSFPLPYNSLEGGLTISPEGGSLYQKAPDRIVEISTDSHVVVAEHLVPFSNRGDPSSGNSEIILSDDGQYMAIINYYLHILNTSDYSVIYQDTAYWFKHGRFNKYTTNFVCTGEDSLTNAPFIMDINLIGIPYKTIYNIGNWFPNRIVPNSTNDTWYILGHIYQDYWTYVVYNVDEDTVLYKYEMCPGNGDIEITPDGDYTFFSQPGSWAGYCSPPKYITMCDNDNNTIKDEIEVFDDSLQVVIPNELCITPDGRHIIGIGEFLGLFDFNLKNSCIERYLIPYTGQMYNLTCQSNP